MNTPARRNAVPRHARSSGTVAVAAALSAFAAPCFGQAGTVTLNPTPRCVVVSALDVQVNLSGAGVPVVGGQFFMEFDPAILQYTGVQPGNSPFSLIIFSQGNQAQGSIDLAVGVPGGGPGALSGTMAVLQFNVLDQGCGLTDLIHFRSHSPPTRLSDAGGTPLVPTLVSTPRMIIDGPPLHACRVDLDVSGRIEPVDVALFITKWTTSLSNSTLDADFDGNGAVAPADVATFVNAWFAALSGGC